MRQIKMQGGLKHPEKIGLVLLAAPDIDIDVFKSDLRAYGKLRKPYYIVLSKDDKALALSKFLAGGRARVGDDGNVQDLAKLGAVVIDLTMCMATIRRITTNTHRSPRSPRSWRHVLQSGIQKNHVGMSDQTDQMASTLGAVVSVPVNLMGNSFSIISSR